MQGCFSSLYDSIETALSPTRVAMASATWRLFPVALKYKTTRPPLAPFGRFCETFARRHFAALAIVPVLFVRHGDTLTMGDVRERQASWEAEHTETSA